MHIVHFCPFAPNQCGMYETARDMIKAERMQGHESDIVHVNVKGVVPVEEDRRGDMVLKPISDKQAIFADLIVSNCNVPQSFLDKTTAPVIQIAHGRPEGSFAMSLTGNNPVYDIYNKMANNPRFKMFISLWKEHDVYFKVLVGDKMRSTPFPPCDRDRYTKEGRVHDWGDNKGKYNILIPETWREDRGPFHLLHGLMELGERMQGLKVHIYACNNANKPWRYIFDEMISMGILGEVRGIMRDIVPVYRAADLVVTSHRMATRVVREALSVGVPVAATQGNRHTPHTFIGDNPTDIANVIEKALLDDGPKEWIEQEAKNFNLEDFGKEIINLYKEVI